MPTPPPLSLAQNHPTAEVAEIPAFNYGVVTGSTTHKESGNALLPTASLTRRTCLKGAVLGAVGSLVVARSTTAHAATARAGAPRDVGTSTAPASATVAWQPPAQTGGMPITGYRVSRNGVDSTGAGAYTTTVAASSRSFTFTYLVPGSTYNLSVAAITAQGTGVAASKPATIRKPPPAGADWTTHFASAALFAKDFNLESGHQDFGSNSSWLADGKSTRFLPYQFHTDASAPAGEYVRLFCDKASLHPSDNSHGYGWLSSSCTGKRGWTSGYLEFSARFPTAGSGKGMFPAPAWTYAQRLNGTQTDNTGTFTAVANQGSFEIDLCEIFGTPYKWGSTAHPGNGANDGFVSSSTTPDQWHTWGLDWNPAQGKLDVYYDGVHVGSKSADASRYAGVQMVPKLDYTVFVGSSWGTNADSTTPSSLYCDVSYVRHYPSKPF